MGKTYKKRKNSKKEYFSPNYEDIYWPENDKMRSNVNKMWDNLNREEKRKLKKLMEKN